MISKAALRAEMRARRAKFPPSEPVIVSPNFTGRLRPGLVVASYRPIGSEADPEPLARAAADAGCTLALPHVLDRATPLRFLSWTVDMTLIAGPFGLEQPHAESLALDPDIILTPLVAFDRSGGRLGQGAGHYDRAFAAYPDAWRIGVAWSVQETVYIPVDPWDVPLHAITTEKEWITT